MAAAVLLFLWGRRDGVRNMWVVEKAGGGGGVVSVARRFASPELTINCD